MASPAPAIDAELEAVTAALAAVEPRTKRLLLFGSRARGDARPDSDFDVLVVMPQATLTPHERQQATRSLRAALRPLPMRVAVDLVVVGAADAERLAGSRWHVVARALREGRELHAPAEDALLRLCCAGPHRRRAHTPAWGGARATSASRNF